MAMSCNGGTGALPTVNRASKAQSRTAVNPIKVARDVVIGSMWHKKTGPERPVLCRVEVA